MCADRCHRPHSTRGLSRPRNQSLRHLRSRRTVHATNRRPRCPGGAGSVTQLFSYCQRQSRSPGDFGGKAAKPVGRALGLDTKPSGHPGCPRHLTPPTPAESIVPDGARERAGEQVRCGKPCQDTSKGGPGPSLRGARSVRGSGAPLSEGWLCRLDGLARGTVPDAVYKLEDRPPGARWSSSIIADSSASMSVPATTNSHTLAAAIEPVESWASAAGEGSAMQGTAPRASGKARRDGQDDGSHRRAAPRHRAGRQRARDGGRTTGCHRSKLTRVPP